MSQRPQKQASTGGLAMPRELTTPNPLAARRLGIQTVMLLCLASPFLLTGCGDKAKEFIGEKAAQLLAKATDDNTQSDPVVLPTPQPPLERAMQALRERGVDTSGGVEQRGGELRLTYETASATEYDDKLLVVWATAFGALGRVAKTKVTVVNTVGGTPVVEVSASTHDIRGMLDGAIETNEFMRRLKIVSVERHPHVVDAPEPVGSSERDSAEAPAQPLEPGPSAAEHTGDSAPAAVPTAAPVPKRVQVQRRPTPRRARRPARPSNRRQPVRRPRARRPGR